MRGKKTAVFCLAAAMAASVFLSGCTGKAAEKAQEYKELGIAQMESGDYESAAENFQKALDQSVGSIGAQELDLSYYKAMALYKSGDTKGALDTCGALIDYDDKNWEVYYLRGNIYLQEKQNEEALADYAEAVSLNKDDVELYVHIYEDLSDAGLGESGQEYYDKVMSLSPSTGEEYYYIGDMYFLTGDYENARTNLLQAEEKGYDRALLMLGQIYKAEGSDEEARKAFSAYMEKYPEDAEALGELGAIALSAGEYEDAVTYLESALEAVEGGKDAQIEKNLIAAYEYSGDFGSASDLARTFLESYSDPEVEREYEFLKTRVSGSQGAAEAGKEENGGSEETAPQGQEAGEQTTDSEAENVSE